jgi:colicin import membrane protein
MWKKLLDPQSYGLAILVAVILHVVIIALFAIQWPAEKRQMAEPTPKNIQAKVIQTESKQAKQRKLAEQKRLKDENWKKYLAKKKAAKDKARKAKAKKDKAAKDKAKKLAAKNKADKKKALALKQKELKKEELKKKELAAEKKRLKQEELEEQQAFEREQEAELLEALAVEEQERSIEKALLDEQQVQKNEAITNSIVAQIQAKIYETWRYPPSARPDMRVRVKIQLVPTGEVINVSITVGSGNEAVDRSVIAAVKRAQPLPVPKDGRIFEQQFRNFSMEFSPKDAVW